MPRQRTDVSNSGSQSEHAKSAVHRFGIYATKCISYIQPMPKFIQILYCYTCLLNKHNRCLSSSLGAENKGCGRDHFWSRTCQDNCQRQITVSLRRKYSYKNSTNVISTFTACGETHYTIKDIYVLIGGN